MDALRAIFFKFQTNNRYYWSCYKSHRQETDQVYIIQIQNDKTKSIQTQTDFSCPLLRQGLTKKNTKSSLNFKKHLKFWPNNRMEIIAHVSWRIIDQILKIFKLVLDIFKAALKVRERLRSGRFYTESKCPDKVNFSERFQVDSNMKGLNTE